MLIVRDCKLKRSCRLTAHLRCRWLGELSQMRNALLRPDSTADGKDAGHLAKVLTACVAHVSLLHEQQHKALVSLLLSMPIWESTKVTGLTWHIARTRLVCCLLHHLPHV